MSFSLCETSHGFCFLTGLPAVFALLVVKWCEFYTYQEWLKQDIRQILIETHNAPMPNVADFFFALHDAGFVIFNKEANYMNGAGAAEYGFIKLSTDFFVNNTRYNKT